MMHIIITFLVCVDTHLYLINKENKICVIPDCFCHNVFCTHVRKLVYVEIALG